LSRSLFDQNLEQGGKGAWHFETLLQDQGLWPAAGVDEVGRGCLAGPVVAAAVILPEDISSSHGITDSKKLTPTQRQRLAKLIHSVAISVSIARVEPSRIDEINILQASLEAMRLAVKGLSLKPKALLVDGNQQIPMPLPQKVITKGDSRSCSIAAASIVAKVYRDKIMAEYSEEFPAYRFDKHKGYATKEHKTLLQKFGPCAIHRKSFKGVIQDALHIDTQK